MLSLQKLFCVGGSGSVKRAARTLSRRIAAGVLPMLLLAVILVTIQPSESFALSGQDFDPGNIISNANFYDPAAMSETEIQSFLVAKGSGLSTYRSDVSSRPKQVSSVTGNVRCEAFEGGSALLASSIIYRAQASCGISAKVLLVTLQKEQGLILKSDPSQPALDRAMGYACPDTAPCAEYALGFGNQVYMGALQLNTYRAANFAMQPGVHSIQFNPDVTCGATSVNVQNYATIALYNYTPYQPNASALANLTGSGDGCGSYGNRNFWVFYNNWFGSPTGPPTSPIGNFELATTTINSATFRGWALDPETSAPIAVHLYVNGNWGGAFTASTPRADVSAAYPSYGPLHGFEFTVPVGLGTFQACIYAINVGAGTNQALGCKSVSTPVGPPFGNFEAISTSGHQASLTGWAIDPDSPESISMTVRVNGTQAGTFPVDAPRPDIAAAFPGYGEAHGFQKAIVAVPGGVSDVCAYATNIGVGEDRSLGCRTVSAPSGPPLGNFEAISTAGHTATLSGWVIDPDTAASVAVHVYVNGQWGGAFVADAARPDVSSAYPGYGEKHGFNAMTVNVPGGVSQVCAYGINLGLGYNQSLGCRTVTTPSGPPLGNFEAVTVVDHHAVFTGWVIDPDGSASVAVHVYVNGQWGGAFVADGSRPDVAAAYPGYGDKHGFNAMEVIVPSGVSQVCVFGINFGQGYNQSLGCKTIRG